MFHLIERLVPAVLHQRLLRIAFRLRHHWRQWRKATITGCNVVVTDLQGNILLLRHSYGPPVWALPGGGVKSGEDPGKAALRELMEELQIAPAKLRPLGAVEGEVSGAPHVAHLFAAVIDRHPQPDNREVIEARFFPPHSLPEPLGKVTKQQLEVWRANQGG